MAPQGATRIKKGLPFACPTGMELGGALRIGPRNFSKIFFPGGLKIEPSAILIVEG